VSAGLAGYFIGTRAVGSIEGWRYARAIGLAAIAATVRLAFLRPLLTTTVSLSYRRSERWSSPPSSRGSARPRLRQVAADPLSLLRR
jgi:hypothetical protein